MLRLVFVIAMMFVCFPVEAAEPPEQIAAKAYRAGHVLDAIAELERAIPRAASPEDAWVLSELLAQTCINSSDVECLRRNGPLFNTTGEKIKQPQRAARRFLFLIMLERYLSGDNKFILDRDGLDFSLKFSDITTDPEHAARFFILNARVAQHGGDYISARRYINRAFASLLRMNTDIGGYTCAVLLQELISVVFANHDSARGLKWLAVASPFLERHFSPQSIDKAQYHLLIADVLSNNGNYEEGGKAYDRAFDSFSTLQIGDLKKQVILSMIVTANATTVALRGDMALAREQFAKHPMHARRDAIIQAGAAQNYFELYYIAAEIFFDYLSGKKPDARWTAVLSKTPDWQLGADATGAAATYKRVAAALLADTPPVGRQLFNEAIAAHFDFFEKKRSDTSAFPLPMMLDRLLIGMGIQYWSAENPAEGTLLVRGMELLNRNARYAVSDALTTMAAQESDEQRRAAHAVLRLTDRQEAWEVAQLAELVTRISERRPFPVKNWSPSQTARDFDHALQRLAKGMRTASTQLPTLAELQSSLRADEAFVGFVSGKRVCVRPDGLWTAVVFTPHSGDGLSPLQQYQIDIKLLLASLTDQNRPSEQRDSQFPVEAAMRLYGLLFGGFDACLAGVKQVEFFAPNDVAAIPLSVLLKEPPPRLGSGYDLSKAHWLVRDYAVTQVTSIRDFLSTRSLSRRPGGDFVFAGVGNPRLSVKLADGQTGENNIVTRSGAVGMRSLQNLAELPETAFELEMIAAGVKGNSTVLLGDEATEERFRALPLAQYQVFHFATHGLVRGDVSGLAQPALVFTPKDMDDERNDGLLTASDIASLTLRARLVVLSACNTANFDPAAFNSQIQGLSSAFAVAGVPATVASLWSVESQTTVRLMANLYKHLLSPDAPGVALALQRAILDTISSAPTRAGYHPRFWAPFIALGDGAARVEPVQNSLPVQSLVAVTDSVGEILGAVGRKGGVVTSEIGPVYAGRHASLVTARATDNKVLWTLEDKEIGAGEAVAFGTDIIVSGYHWDGRSIPVLRAITAAGKVRWKITPKSRFESAMIERVLPTAEAIFVVLTPLNQAVGGYEFEVVRLNAAGVEQNRFYHRKVMPSLYLYNLRITAATLGKDLFISVSRPGVTLKTYRDDFTLISVCAAGGGTDLIRLDSQSFELRREVSIADLGIEQLIAASDRILFAGAQRSTCEGEGERPLLGEVSAELLVKPLWRDDSAFAGKLVAALPTKKGWLAIGPIYEPINFTTQTVDEAGNIVPPPVEPVGSKRADSRNNRLTATLVTEIDKDGKTVSRRTLSSGLPQAPMGLVQTGTGPVIYGSSGFNPWLEHLSR